MDVPVTPSAEASNVIPFKNGIQSSFELVPNLVRLLGVKDETTRSHVVRVHSLTQEWMSYLRSKWLLLEANIEVIEVAALLHDIGKVGVLDEVLQKRDSLTRIERDHLEQHSDIGYQLVRDFPGMAQIAEAIRHHHERWDGAGYPLGLRENQIPIASRIIAIVDAYDAIVSERPYKKAESTQVAMKEIEKEAGRQFCPQLAPLFIQFMHARNS